MSGHGRDTSAPCAIPAKESVSIDATLHANADPLFPRTKKSQLTKAMTRIATARKTQPIHRDGYPATAALRQKRLPARAAGRGPPTRLRSGSSNDDR